MHLAEIKLVLCTNTMNDCCSIFYVDHQYDAMSMVFTYCVHNKVEIRLFLGVRILLIFVYLTLHG